MSETTREIGYSIPWKGRRAILFIEKRLHQHKDIITGHDCEYNVAIRTYKCDEPLKDDELPTREDILFETCKLIWSFTEKNEKLKEEDESEKKL